MNGNAREESIKDRLNRIEKLLSSLKQVVETEFLPQDRISDASTIVLADLEDRYLSLHREL